MRTLYETAGRADGPNACGCLTAWYQFAENFRSLIFAALTGARDAACANGRNRSIATICREITDGLHQKPTQCRGPQSCRHTLGCSLTKETDHGAAVAHNSSWGGSSPKTVPMTKLLQQECPEWCCRASLTSILSISLVYLEGHPT